MSRFIQIHFLTPYAATLLNRDDAGFAKRLPFGGTERTRISSQCLKRHWRTFDGKGSFQELNIPGTIRSRVTFEKKIVEKLEAEGIPQKEARQAADLVKLAVLGQSDKAKAKKKGEEAGPVHTDQVTVLGQPEIDFLTDQTRKIVGLLKTEPADKVIDLVFDKEGKKNLKAIQLAGGLGAAMFGRMVTSDMLARGDAAIHVAHAFTVHAQESESDYFSAIDDLVKAEGELGSGHIGNTELNSGLYYGYVVVDVNLLISNLAGNAALAGQVIGHLVQLIAKVSPGAKLGSTAPYAYASALLIEAGDEQPRSLANAFHTSVNLKGDVLQNTYGALAKHLGELDRIYGNDSARRFVGVQTPSTLLAQIGAVDGQSLAALAAWTAERVAG